jgi:hypothetical protein
MFFFFFYYLFFIIHSLKKNVILLFLGHLFKNSDVLAVLFTKINHSPGSKQMQRY